MRFNPVAITIIFLFSLIILGVEVKGAECNVTFADNCSVTTTMTISNINTYVNDTLNTGVIVIKNSNINITCINVTFYGDNASGMGINFNFKNNVTINGCNVGGYYRNFYLSGVSNNTLYNVSSWNPKSAFIYMTGNNNTISNSIFYNITSSSPNPLFVDSGNGTKYMYNKIYNNPFVNQIESSGGLYRTFIGNNISGGGTIYLTGSKNILTDNIINLTNSTTNQVIRISNPSNETILRNSIIGIDRTKSVGIYLNGTNGVSDYNNITGNNVTGLLDGIKVIGSGGILYNSYIDNNYVHDVAYSVGGTGIFCAVNASNCVITNNRINGTRNAIAFNGMNSIAQNNSITLWTHGCFDLNAQAIEPNKINNITILNNSCYDSDTADTGIGVYLMNATNINVENNSFRNCHSFGIQEANVLGIENITIKGNQIGTLSNGTEYCLSIQGITGNIIQNNNFLYCPVGEVIYNDNVGIIAYIDNNATDGTFNLDKWSLDTAVTNMSFQSQSNYLRINDSDRIINYSYSGVKYLTLYGDNFSIINQLLQYPFNDVRNSSNNVILESNIDNYSITLNPNEHIEIGNFDSLSIILNDYPTAQTSPNVSFNMSVSDPDSLYNFTRVYILYKNLSVLNYSDNDSLTPIISFDNLSVGDYVFMVYAFLNNSQNVSSLGYDFQIVASGSADDSPTCESEQQLITALGVFIILIIVLMFVLIVFNRDNPAIIGFIVVGSFVATIILLIGYHIVKSMILTCV